MRTADVVPDLATIREQLLRDLEETLEGQGYVPMYDFAWTLRGYELGLTPRQVHDLSLDAYRELIARFSLRLVWNRWPQDLEGAWAASPETDLEFDLDPDRPAGQPLQLLVPQDGPPGNTGRTVVDS